ncbi:MAG: rRNA-binding ribosome biosynthesis protein rpf2 [Candelina mexicana]|nr:MAG: rRNA-binding ribosome biosynthesis protein rpf2 [Candelina mexicana]
MLRQIVPRNARSKRALEKRAPQLNENAKTTLFLKGSSCSDIVQLALTDLHSLKRPLSIKFTKKNSIHPFEDASSLEFFSEKNDASLLVLGSHSKKRPHCLTLVRTFDSKVLDMLELYLDPETLRTLGQFKNRKCAVGLKPLMVFSGTAFESPTPTPYTLAKSLLTDFFIGQEAQTVDVEGLQCIVSISMEEEREGEPAPKIHLRIYLIRTKKSSEKLPRAEVEEMGPRMDFRIGRMKQADEGMMKEALKRPKYLEVGFFSCLLGLTKEYTNIFLIQPKQKKNVETDIVGDKIGRIHLGRQDLDSLQSRKMKGLKRRRDAEIDVEEDDTTIFDGDENSDGGAKRTKI